MMVQGRQRAADEAEIWGVVGSFDPEPRDSADLLAYRSVGECGLEGLPANWQETAFVAGPLSFITVAVMEADGGGVRTETIAVLDGREEVLMSIWPGSEGQATLLWDPTAPSGANAVRLAPCDDGPSLHVGGFHAPTRNACVAWQIRVGNEVAVRATIPVEGGSCAP